MPKMSLVPAIILALIVAATPTAHGVDPEKEEWKSRSPIHLLPEYRIQVRSDFEGGVHGKIWKQGGPSIAFDVDIYTPSAVDSVEKGQIAWREEQSETPGHVICIYTKSKDLLITFGGPRPANFRSKIRGQRDLAEVLLMVLTFEPINGYPVDPSAISHQP